MGFWGKLFGKSDTVQEDLLRGMGRDTKDTKRTLNRQMGREVTLRNVENINWAVLEGRKAARVGDYEAALYYCDEALTMRPKMHKLWINKGAALTMLGKHKDAIECFDRAIEIKPKGEDAYFNKGTTYIKMNDLKEALKCFDHAIELKPKYAKAWYNKGVILQRVGKDNESDECFEKAYKFDHALGKQERPAHKSEA